jgi:O-antigen/teichoic acid export membrane protein
VRKRKLLKDSIGFAIAQYLVRMVLMLRGLIAARLLGPLPFGAWNAIQIMMDYGSFATIGTQQGLDQMVPARMVSGDHASRQRLKRAALFNIVVLTGLFAFGCLAWASYGESRILGAWGLRGVGLALACVASVNLAYYLISILRSHDDFQVVSGWFMFQSVVGAGIGLALAPWLGAWGLLWGWFAGCLASLVWVARKARGRAPLWPAFAPESLQLIRVGFPMFVFTASGLLMRSLDRIIILRYLGTESLGYYSLSVMTLTLLLYLPDSIGYVLYPQLLKRFSQAGEDAGAIRETVVRVLTVMAVLVPLLSGLGYLWAREAVLRVLPEFLPGVGAVRVLCFGAAGLAMGTLASIVLMTVGRRQVLIPAALFAAATGAVLGVLAIRLGHGITGVAWASWITYLLNGGLLLALALVGTGVAVTALPGVLARVLAPLPLAMLLAYAADRAMPWADTDHDGLRLARLALGSLAFATLYLLLASPFARGAGLKQLLSEFNLPLLSPLMRRLGGAPNPPEAT